MSMRVPFVGHPYSASTGGFWRSQATFRVRVALNLKGIAYHEIPVDLDAGAQHAPAFREVKPAR